jgi:hypothetical protein
MHHIFVGGYQPSGDAQLHADVLFRHAGAADIVIAAADSTIPVGSDAGLPGEIDAVVPGIATGPTVAGDLLVLHVQMTAGTDGYIEIGTHLTIP